MLFVADSGSDRRGLFLGGGGRLSDGGRGSGNGCDCDRLSHGFVFVDLGRVAPSVTTGNAGGDGECQRQEEEEAELHYSLVMRLLFPKRLGRRVKGWLFDGCPRRRLCCS